MAFEISAPLSRVEEAWEDQKSETISRPRGEGECKDGAPLSQHTFSLNRFTGSICLLKSPSSQTLLAGIRFTEANSFPLEPHMGAKGFKPGLLNHRAVAKYTARRQFTSPLMPDRRAIPREKRQSVARH